MDNINELLPLSNDWNKERLEKLKNLFPDLFTNEGKLNIDELKKVIDPKSVSETERYEFRWFGKSEAKRSAFTPSNATLFYDEKRSVNPTENENIIIEGENLEVLKLLSNSYRDQVKCIYIDPPYNTGKDFVYSDNYTEEKKPYWEQTGVTENGLKIDTNNETDGRFHSNWLNMMYSRLLIARAILKPEGVIFISIDDNEVHHLRKLCDEVFGEENLIGVFAWKNKYGAGAKTRGFIEVHEYILCYSKNPLVDIEAELTAEQIGEYKKKDEKFPIRGGYVTQPLMTKSLDDRANLQYSIVHNGITIKPRKQWVWEEKRLLEAIKNDEIVIKEKKNGTYSVRAKVYLKDENGVLRKGKPITILNGPFNQEGTEEVEELLGEDIFSFPKPKQLLKYLFSFIINNFDDKSGLYLDFFSGSGTSGQAIQELNIKDGGNRKYILIQMPEATDEKSETFKAGYKKISDITIDRNKKVVEKIIEEKKKEKPDLFTNGHKEDAIKGLGFKVFKLVKSNFPRVEWAPDTEKTEAENVETLKQYIRDKEAQLVTAFNRDELMTEILMKNGFTLNYKTEKQKQFKKNDIFLATDGVKETLICLDTAIDIETVEHCKKHTDKKFICLERALDTTRKYNLKHYLGDKFNAF
ncbi:MAG TPA: site-specific DNA-methyltransferase [Chitinophagaceae bacterium]|nr:site-specific DNA-methyltransferase [Chitinophagaceae bacterium]